MERRRSAIYGTTLIAALVVGILLGRYTCSGRPEVRIERKVVERRVPVASPDACSCGPKDVGVPETGVSPEPRRPEKKAEDDLPEAPEPPDPTTRRKLLAWVRDKSTALQPCRTESLTETQYAVTFQLDEQGAIEEVRINAPDKDVDDDVLECLRRRMADWEPPKKLVEGQRELVFGLRL